MTEFLSENFQFFEVKFSVYLNRRVFVIKNHQVVLTTDRSKAVILVSLLPCAACGRSCSLFSCFVLFVFLLCVLGPVQHCDHLVEREG